MILEISSANEKVLVEIASNGGKKKIRVGDTEILCDWVRLTDGHYSLILNGSVLDVLVDIDPESCVVTSRAGTFSFRVVDPRRSGLMQKIEDGQAGLEHILRGNARKNRACFGPRGGCRGLRPEPARDRGDEDAE